jgi:citrate lyase gamma subunit
LNISVSDKPALLAVINQRVKIAISTAEKLNAIEG